MVTLEEIRVLENRIHQLERQAKQNDAFAEASEGNTWSGITQSCRHTAELQYAEAKKLRGELKKLQVEYNAQYTTCTKCGGHGKVLKEG